MMTNKKTVHKSWIEPIDRDNPLLNPPDDIADIVGGFCLLNMRNTEKGQASEGVRSNSTIIRRYNGSLAKRVTFIYNPRFSDANQGPRPELRGKYSPKVYDNLRNMQIYKIRIDHSRNEFSHETLIKDKYYMDRARRGGWINPFDP